MNRRMKKKKGLLQTSADRKLKEYIRKEIEMEAEALEKLAEKVMLPDTFS